MTEQAKHKTMSRTTLRRILFIIFTLVIIIVAGLAIAWWLVERANYIRTDNAYVDANVAKVMAQTEGSIAEIRFEDTQAVKRGDVLVILDDADAQIALAEAEADYARAVINVRQYFEKNKETSAQVALAQAVLHQAKIDLKRRRKLHATKSISQEELTNAQAAYDTAFAAEVVAQRHNESQTVLTNGSEPDTHPEVLVKKSAIDAAQLSLERTVIRAPIKGIIIQRRASLGQQVEVGATMMSIVPLDQVFVNANFKENQLTKVHIGQPATLTADLYGNDIIYHGSVVGMGAGTGSAFAIIPAQNATGSWIKVVQRIPVRINLNADELRVHPLRVGLSMNVKIDIRE